MLSILIEDVESDLLDFRINLNLTPNQTINFELQYSEELDKFPASYLTGVQGLSDDELELFYEKVGILIDEFAVNELTKLTKSHGFIMSCGSAGSSSVLYEDPNTASISRYYTITNPKLPFNISKEMKDKLGTFKIRIANHINKSEIKGVKNLNNIKIFHQYLPNMYKTELIEYSTNIFQVYVQFINSLSTYNEQINSFEDIKQSDILKVKKFSVQGDFPDYSK